MSAAATKPLLIRRKHRLPEWLFISKTLNKEAVDALNERAEWTWNDCSQSVSDTTKSSVLFSPSTAQIVTVWLGDLAPTRIYAYVGFWQTTGPNVCFDLSDNADFDTFREFASIDVEFLEAFRRVPLRNFVIYISDDVGILKMDKEGQKNLDMGFKRMERAVLGDTNPHEGFYHEAHWQDEEHDYCIHHWYQFQKADRR
ncbi:Nn.00g097370.m01.CDS01 [Neocucurbitaria sp. VM-36]